MSHDEEIPYFSEKDEDDDEKIFLEEDSNNKEEEDSHKKADENQQIIDEFKRKIVIPKPNAGNDPNSNWYEFKENDDLNQMLQKKIEEKAREKERIERENKKKCRKIMRNPVEYINFIKTYLLCSVDNIVKISRTMFSEQLQAYLISKMKFEDIETLEKIGKDYAIRKTPLDFLLRDLLRMFNRYFVFKQFNSFYFLHNLAFNNSFSHEQIIWLFAALCQYLRIPVRFVSIIDMTSFNLDRKYKANIKSVEKNHKNEKKRKYEEFPENSKTFSLKKKKSANNLIDKCIKTLIEGKTSNSEEKKESNKDFRDSEQNNNFGSQEENVHNENINDNDDEYDENNDCTTNIDDFFKAFNFKRDPNRSDKKEISQELLQNLPKNLNSSTEILDIHSFNFENSLQSKPLENKNVNNRLFSDSYEASEYKYWLEIYDYEMQKWIIVNPVLQEIYKEVYPPYIRAKIHGTPALFILSAIKFNEFELKNPNYIFKKSGIFINDVTMKYCEKWTKILINRRQLSLKFWWEKLLDSLTPENNLNIPEWAKEIFESERILSEKIAKEDLPTSYNEFRNSPYYILPSHLKKYQGLKPDSKPLPDLTFKDEPVYLRADVVELHTKSKWRTLGRKVIHGQTGIKKVLALTNDGEQMVDLYGEWQTEEIKNIINEDGTLPKNEYGNYELFGGEPPSGTLHLDLPFISRLCKKYQIDYVDTVVGFERKNGRTHAVKQGVLIFEKDKEKVLKLYEDYAKDMFEKEKEKEVKKIISVWKKLLKSILIKRYIKENYENT